MLVELVQEAGLTENQAQAYVALSKQGTMSAGELAKHISKDRSYMYSILEDLAKKGLVSSHKDGKQLYNASNPENLLQGLEEKEKKLQKAIKKLRSIESEAPLPEPKLYKGKEGLKTFVRKFLQASEFCTFGGGKSAGLFELLKYDYLHYLEDMRNSEITGRLLTKKDREQEYRELYGDLVEVKTVEKDGADVHYTVFSDYVAIYTGGEDAYVILIENLAVSCALKEYFNLLWSFC